MNHPTSIELGHLEYGLGGDRHCLQLLCKSLCTSVQDRFLCKYGKCPKIFNTKFSDKMAYANSAHPDQTAPEGAV